MNAALDRAVELAAVLNFLDAGDRWPWFLPHDAELHSYADDPVVFLEGVEMRPIPGGWRLRAKDGVSV